MPMLGWNRTKPAIRTACRLGLEDSVPVSGGFLLFGFLPSGSCGRAGDLASGGVRQLNLRYTLVFLYIGGNAG